MATSHIQPLQSVGENLSYVEHGKSGKEPYRCAGAYFSRDDLAEYARAIPRGCGRKYEGYGLRLSWSPEELDPADPASVNQAIALTQEVISRLYPHCEYFIGVHTDGKGGKVHTHAAVVNHDYMTGRAIRENRTHRAVSRAVDEVMRTNNISAESQAGSWRQRRAELEATPGKFAFDVWLGDTLSRAKARARNLAEFLNLLDLAGVETRIKRDADGQAQGITYAAHDQFSKRKSKRRRAGSRIAEEFTLQSLNDDAFKGGQKRSGSKPGSVGKSRTNKTARRVAQNGHRRAQSRQHGRSL